MQDARLGPGKRRNGDDEFDFCRGDQNCFQPVEFLHVNLVHFNLHIILQVLFMVKMLVWSPLP